MKDHSILDVGLVSCTKSKKETASTPAVLYEPSPLFRKAREYCRTHHDEWYILSAKHGLLEPDGPKIDPYDKTLNNASKGQRTSWSQQVLEQLQNHDLLDGTLYFHAGQKYYDQLLSLLDEKNVDYELPVKGLRMGETMNWYDERLETD